MILIIDIDDKNFSGIAFRYSLNEDVKENMLTGSVREVSRIVMR